MRTVFGNSRFTISIYYYGKVIGICPFVFSEEGIFKVSNFGTAYNVLLIIFYTFIYVLIMHSRLMYHYPQETHLGVAVDIFWTNVKI